MKKIIPTIPNYEIIDNKYENIKNKNIENSQEKDLKESKIYYASINGKNYYYLIDDNLLLGNWKLKQKILKIMFIPKNIKKCLIN